MIDADHWNKHRVGDRVPVCVLDLDHSETVRLLFFSDRWTDPRHPPAPHFLPFMTMNRPGLLPP